MGFTEALQESVLSFLQWNLAQEPHLEGNTPLSLPACVEENA